MNRRWLEKVMADRGITYYALKTQFKFSPDTFKAWENGHSARPDTMRRLAEALDVDYPTLVKGLGVKVEKPVPPKEGQFGNGRKEKARAGRGD